MVARLDWEPRAGLNLGVSGYAGRADQNLITVNDTRVSVPVRMVEIHAQFQHRGLEMRALYVHTWLAGSQSLNRYLGLTGPAGVAEQMYGGYVEIAYRILFPGSQTDAALIPFLRYERYNTQHRVAPGFLADPARDITLWTLGMTLRPMTQVVLKADLQFRTPAVGDTVRQFNLGLGFNF